jgi:hypothetical protein
MADVRAGDADRFYASFPLWTLQSAGMEKAGFGPEDGIPVVNAPSLPPALAIFTGRDLAERFVEATLWPNLVPLRLQRPADLLAVAEHFQRVRKVRHVAIDTSFDPPGAQVLVPIGDFIDAVRRGSA